MCVVQSYHDQRLAILFSHFNPVTLSGGTNNPNFRGFMIQGRVVAGDSPTGEFTGESSVSQPQCDDDVSCMQF